MVNRIGEHEGSPFCSQFNLFLDFRGFVVRLPWDSIINNLICDEFSINESQLMLFIESNFMLPECLKYLQIGNPDLVVIASGKHLPLTK